MFDLRESEKIVQELLSMDKEYGYWYTYYYYPPNRDFNYDQKIKESIRRFMNKEFDNENENDDNEDEPSRVQSTPHSVGDPNDIECIQITEDRNYCIGEAIKHLWRTGLKKTGTESEIEDLQKAVWYINREIDRQKRLLNK